MKSGQTFGAFGTQNSPFQCVPGPQTGWLLVAEAGLNAIGVIDPRRGQVLVYWIRLEEHKSARTSFSSAWRNYDQNLEEEKRLEQSVTESGGRVVTIPSLDGVGSAFSGILQELRDQYVLGYYPDQAKGDGAWHKVQVRVDGFGLKVRAREGYVDQ